jgi:uncharacterized protein YbbC (DUF1343 family)
MAASINGFGGDPKSNMDPVIPGIEVLLKEQLHLIRGKRAGLITNHTAIDRGGRHDIDLLRLTPGVRLIALFSPEHGIRGQVQAGETIGDTADTRSGLPVFSLYGRVTRPTPEMLRNIEILIYDIQDVGVRFYTYISTLRECMEAAADHKIPFIVLDRPNPLGGEAIEGGMLDPRFKSFVGAYEIPIRYGLTAGELASFYKETQRLNLHLEVVRMKNWHRGCWYDKSGLPWVAPSPNIPDLDSALAYVGMCLVEGTNLSEGRGTSKPFRLLGAPWVDGNWLAKTLNTRQLAGAMFEPASFIPTQSKYKGQRCQGVEFHVIDRTIVQPVLVAVELLACVRNKYPEYFQWRSEHFDQLVGSDRLRLAIDQKHGTEEIFSEWSKNLNDFDQKRKQFFLYP